MSTDFSVGLTNVALPKTSATLTLRIIKSFEFRTERSLVLHSVNLDTTTVSDLKYIARQGMTSSQLLWKYMFKCRCSYSHATGMGVLSQHWTRLVFFILFCLPRLSSACEDTFKLYTRAHGAKASHNILVSEFHLCYSSLDHESYHKSWSWWMDTRQWWDQDFNRP
jgi:hypothetical protein